jgi:hypothetical protein
MKMILKNILYTSTLLLTGIVFAGCSSSDAPIEQPINPTGKYTMTVNASKGDNATTRALSIDGEGKLIASWATTEDVYVKKGDSWLSGSLKPQAAGESSVLKGEISGAAIAASDVLSLQFPRTTIDYTGQVGTLDNIAVNYDYATATTTVSSVSGNTFTSSDASFANQQAIVKFTLQNAYGETLAVDKLTVSATGLKTSDTATGNIVITPASATDVIYAALSGITDEKVTLTATKGSDTYALTTPSTVSFTDGNYYTITAKLRPSIFYEPLTFEWVGEDCKVSFTSYNSGKLEYSLDKVTWTAYTTGITLTSTNPIVYFRGDKATKYNSDSESTKISCDKKCKVYGNIMSLIDPTHYATLTELPGTHVFHELFKKEDYNSNEFIINHETKDLVLPATTLTSACYKAMFYGCAGLTRAPVLPAPALVANCYEMMFSGCTNLNYIKCLATSGINMNSSTASWVNGVSDSGTFVKASASTVWTTGDSGIPSDWSVSP